MKAIAIGGTVDHLHALLSLPSIMSFAKAVQLIKGGSSKWIHDTFREYRKFAWQEGYGLSASVHHKARKQLLIHRQKEHHRKRSFKDEFIDLLDKHSIEYDLRYIFR